MKSTEQIEHGLKLLREADAGKCAPDVVGTRLLAAFREQHTPQPKPIRNRWMWAVPALAAAAAAAFVIVRLTAPGPAIAPPRPTPIAGIRIEAPAPEHPVAVAEVRRPVKPRAARPLATARVRPAEETQDFIPIPYAPPLTAWDRGQVVRVGLSRQSLRSLGFPVNEERMFERVPADLLTGEDGIPRGIRFIRTGQ